MDTNFNKKDFEKLKICYGIPLLNSISRNKDLIDQIIEFEIESVGRKVIKTTKSYIHRLSIDGSTCINNFGYLAFPTKKDAEEHLLKISLITELNSKKILEKLSYEELIELKKRI